MSGQEQELFPLSWLSQYGYCPRRCGLLALDEAWEENEETSAGRVGHQRAHTARIERHENRLELYDLPVFSRRLGVNGKCDCVEAQASPEGISLPYGEGRYVLYPVEYKHGVVRDEREYHIQLCAQALCLEEQFGGHIARGAIFFINAHRRDEVTLDEGLRAETCEVAEAVRQMLEKGEIPPAKYSAKCKKCSMREYCQPRMKHSAASYCDALWKLALEEDGHEATT